MDVPVVEDLPLLTRTMLIIFAMVAHLANNFECHWWKEPWLWLHDPALKNKKYRIKYRMKYVISNCWF